MALNSASQSVVVLSTGGGGGGVNAYPLANNPASTATDTASSFLNANIVSIDAIVVEAPGTVGGVLTISDHVGTSGTAITITLPTTTVRASYDFGPYGMATGWKGIKLNIDGTSNGQKVRVLFTPA